MRFPILCWLALLLSGHSSARGADAGALRDTGEKFFAEGSFAKAREVYQQISTNDLPAAERRWLEFRLADTLWRAHAGSQSSDPTPFDEARRQLEALVRDRTRVEEHDRVWAEVQEALGDFWWTRRNSRDGGQGWERYAQALDWWAGTADLELARDRYLKIVWRFAQPPQPEPYYFYGFDGNLLPLEILENALKIAGTENDRARAHYLLAMTLRNQGDAAQLARVPEEFDAALRAGRATDWYDDALFHYAEFLAGGGRVVWLKAGGWNREPDYPQALALFRRLEKEFTKGETRYFEPAQQQIKSITQVQVGLGVPHVFLPDSEVQYFLNWRNVPRVDLALYAVDLTRDVKFAGERAGNGEWLRQIELAGREKISAWTKETADKGDHLPGQAELRLEKKLPPGAYVLEAIAGGERARDLILVSDLAVVLKTTGKQVLAYVCRALDGAPAPQARVKLWERHFEEAGRKWLWREAEQTANADGIAVFDLARSHNQVELFVGAATQERQAFALGTGHSPRAATGQWRIYAFTDRPAYRPGETVNWKFTARTQDGAAYATPADQVVEFEITDPRGAKVKADRAKLNAFGSAWGTVELTDKMPLGEYHVTFWTEGRKQSLGANALFRLEEYKLPEFKVAVTTPEENGRRKTFRLGDKVEVSIQADYYFGGAVANATVEVLVRQSPYYAHYAPRREFAWYYDDASPAFRPRWDGNEPIIKRETLRTDAAGRATVTFDTPRDAAQDFEYSIEARVTDASRREITANDSVRVTRQRYTVHANPAHHLYRPQDSVKVAFQALDANQQPVAAATGTVKVTRDFWFEIWLDPAGKEVKGETLQQLRAANPVFPPPALPGSRPWRLKFRGYEHDEILTRTVTTEATGEAALTFTPGREGYYRVAWSSDDAPTSARPVPDAITAETTVWVATTATAELGYRPGGLEVIVDQDTVRVGQAAPVMLSVPASGRYVLFSVEGEELYSYQIVHVTGTSKLIELPIEERHVPNIFLSGTMVSDGEMFQDTKPVVVPAAKNFLTVEVKPDRALYQPRDAATVTITTRDHEGKPVAAEVALGTVDESVFYIQQDYAGDPRRFFFGTKRPHAVQTPSTFWTKQYVRLQWNEDQQLEDVLRPRTAVEGMIESANGIALSDDSALGGARGGGGGAGNRFLSATKESRGMPLPSPSSRAAGVMQQLNFAVAADAMVMAKADTGSAGSEPAVQVRSDFRSTMFWQPDVRTGSNGQATITLKYPESLTGWKTTARAASAGNQFGLGEATTRTRQPLSVRLQAPRFFVVGDRVTLSAIVNNNTDQSLTVTPALLAEGLDVTGLVVNGEPMKGQAGPRVVAANGETRIDWLAVASQAGTARLRVSARAGQLADAMEKSFLVHEHGIEKFLAQSGKMRGDEITVHVDLPPARRADTTTLTVQVTPSLAVTMLDALPYLVDYPYGCTEQTMSRFLPAVITAKTLRDLGLKPEEVMGRVFGGIETNSAAATHPAGQKNLAELDKMTKAGRERLEDFQHADGGWGWWKQGESDHWMTAYVVWGWSLAQQAGVEINVQALERGASFLDKTLIEEELNPDQQAWMLHALAVHGASQKGTPLTKFQQQAFDNLWANREKLNAYTRALFALAAHHFGKAAEAKTLVENLENGVKRDDRPDASVLVTPATANSSSANGNPGTAHWGEDGFYWRWSDGGVEATAFALRALLAIDPQNRLVEPVTNWLLKNRRGAQWSNTRDTALVVLALNDALRASGELATDLEYELLVNGASVARRTVKGAEVFQAPGQFTIDRALLRERNELRLVRRRGTGPLYFAASAKFFSLEEPVTAAGNELFVHRQYYRIIGRPTLLKGYVYDRVPLADGESVKSGERLETVLTLEAKNHYEYLVFEDLKPAGLEAVAVRSGESLFAQEITSAAAARKFGASTNDPTAQPRVHVVAPGDSLSKIAKQHGVTVATLRAANAVNPNRLPIGAKITIPTVAPGGADADLTGRTRWVHQELRDRQVALFLDRLPEGVWEIRYELRAEVPGTFHALPVLGHAMYVPEIRGNSTEVRLTVEDAKP